MSSPPDSERTTTALDVLAAPQRRYLLAALLDRGDALSTETETETETDLPALPETSATSTSISSSMPVPELATEVAATERGCPIVPDNHCERIHVSLVHAHVPRLVDVGVLTQHTDGSETTVALAAHPMLSTDWVRTLLSDPTGEAFPADETTLDRTLETLREPRRRTICAALASRREAVPIDDLAAAIVSREDGDEPARETVVTSLVHKHLPALADVGLVDYDAGADRVELATDAPQWEADWLVDGPLAEAADLGSDSRDPRRDPDAPEPQLHAATNGGSADARVDTCWTITERDEIVAREREIVDGAAEELFVTVPHAGTVRQACLERWRDAADRGVDVYVGSCSPRVRDTVRSAVPGATVCEPQFDWLNAPIEGDHHGRVVFADRESAMVVTIDESDADEDPRVGAITGDGRENALVSLVREHLGRRLDRITTSGDARDGTPLQL
ncbi:DUF7344 domain-containing protein [Natrinema salifodinae]|uniref:DUF7344 domain-containing protein n=1 Tax=Natrinema salifodinae TaxID=1202768 RepID=A0A1I0Q681_9EURY|nr:hypothetical protein [Natrinema salifodinae]SEW22287.1 hypothetical protein SAMN05216285_3116 [Natrinema salifodinae]